MSGYKDIPYAEWIILINQVQKEGITDDTFNMLQNYYPHKLEPNIQISFFNHVIEIEKVLLDMAFTKFKYGLNQAVSEVDIDLLEIELIRYANRLKKCSFFAGVEIISIENKQRLCHEIYDNVFRFQNEIEKYMKNMCMEESSAFWENGLYLVQKRNYCKSIREWRKNE